ncbi:MAG: amidase [Rhodothermaceae bacterium]|nr:amidase [Rhodothermaceae bacterium]
MRLKGLLVVALVCASCTASPSTPQVEIDYLAPVASDAVSSEMADRIVTSTILELQDAMESGELSAEQLTQFYLDQITAKNDRLRAVIATNPQALETARSLDAERASGEVRGPLHGIPILLKDNIETMEQPTTAGSLALLDNMTNRDAFVAAQLREAGAVFLGKANLSEWANFRSERSSSGWSGVGGQTRNPHNTNKSPCGSSSGSGSAVAGLMAVAALGSETNGSVVCPSAINGVVGIKPTIGLVSRHGIVPISHSQDTAGPMARNVTDAAILLEAMIGYDEADAVTAAAEAQGTPDFTSTLNAGALEGKRVGVIRSSTGYHEGVDALFEKTVEALSNAGVTVVDSLRQDRYSGMGGDTYNILLYEFKADLNAYFAGLPNQLDTLTLETLIQFNKDNEAREMPYFKQEIFEKSNAKGPLTDSEYLDALEKAQEATRNGIDNLLQEHDLDALIAPSYSAAWSIDLVNGDHFLGGFSTFAAVAGYSHITVPMGKLHGLPVGLSFVSTAFDEAGLIELAFAYEQLGH